MVACQWNYCSSRGQQPARWWYGPVGFSRAQGPALTKSSPIGPALHDDGGSLCDGQNAHISRCGLGKMSVPAEIRQFLEQAG